MRAGRFLQPHTRAISADATAEIENAMVRSIVASARLVGVAADLVERRVVVREDENRSVVAGELEKLSGLAYYRSSDLVERVLASAREQLDMEVAFVSEFVGGEMFFRTLEGDAESFRFREGVGSPVEATFCRRVIEGRIPNVVPDAREDDEVKDLGMTRVSGIGSYVGVPVQFSDGRIYGTMCCMSHSADPDLRERDAGFMGVLARLVSEQLEREEIEARNRVLEAKATGAGALLAALEARDGYTGEHSQAVVHLSVAVARRLGLPEDDVAEVEQAALLHDVGKIGVPDSVLNKPGLLDGREWALMREHPAIGERIVSSIESLAHLAPIIRAEHERWDGKGYPDGLSGDAIPLASRIVFCCDSFHAMTSDRPYREAIGIERALEELAKNAGTQFDPNVAAALLDVVGRNHPPA